MTTPDPQALAAERKRAEEQSKVGQAEIQRLIRERDRAILRAEQLVEALRYITGEDVAGYEAHQRPEDVARQALTHDKEQG
jgi:hypothetical protein